MTKKSHIIRKPDFVLTLVGMIASVFIAVGTVGFLSIPYSLSGHPGEVRVVVADTASSVEYHAT